MGVSAFRQPGTEVTGTASAPSARPFTTAQATHCFHGHNSRSRAESDSVPLLANVHKGTLLIFTRGLLQGPQAENTDRKEGKSLHQACHLQSHGAHLAQSQSKQKVHPLSPSSVMARERAEDGKKDQGLGGLSLQVRK